jgi:hypothetical protein
MKTATNAVNWLTIFIIDSLAFGFSPRQSS